MNGCNITVLNVLLAITIQNTKVEIGSASANEPFKIHY